MTRRDGMSNTGWVNWPTRLENTGEGGMAVYLVVPESHEEVPEPFVSCIPDATVQMPYPDAPIYPVGEEFKSIWPVYPEYKKPLDESNSVGLLAAVCLGGSGGSWWNPQIEEYWYCTYNDLSRGGKELYDSLRLLYGKEPILVTVLDT